MTNIIKIKASQDKRGTQEADLPARQPTAPAQFTYMLRAQLGYTAEGTYPATPEQYGDVIRVLEGTLKSVPFPLRPAQRKSFLQIYRSALAEDAGKAPPAQKPVSDQNARFAIDEAISRGRAGTQKPPTDDHWLMEYWLIGQKLASLDATHEAVEAGQNRRRLQASGEAVAAQVKALAAFIRHIGADDMPSDALAERIVDWQSAQDGAKDAAQSCHYPLCQSEEEQAAVAKQVHAVLYGNAMPAEVPCPLCDDTMPAGSNWCNKCENFAAQLLQPLAECSQVQPDTDAPLIPPTAPEANTQQDLDREQAMIYRELRDLYCEDNGMTIEEYDKQIAAALEKKREASR